MTDIDSLLAANADHAARFQAFDSARPSSAVAVVACMDCRVDPADALGLSLGQAHVIRNAGARVSDDVLRSLALSTHALGVTKVVIMQHTRCGLASSTQQGFEELTGASLDFLAIGDQAADLRADIDRLVSQPYLEYLTEVAGTIYDVDTGRLDEVTRWRRP